MNTAIAEKYPLITAADWFGGGRRVPYDLGYHRILNIPDDVNNISTPLLMVFERVVGAPDATGRWITMLPGYPEGSYGYARVNAPLADDLAPRLYVEYVGQGDSDKPSDYHYSTMERADLVEAQWQANVGRGQRQIAYTFHADGFAVTAKKTRKERRCQRSRWRRR